MKFFIICMIALIPLTSGYYYGGSKKGRQEVYPTKEPCYHPTTVVKEKLILKPTTIKDVIYKTKTEPVYKTNYVTTTAIDYVIETAYQTKTVPVYKTSYVTTTAYATITEYQTKYKTKVVPTYVTKYKVTYSTVTEYNNKAPIKGGWKGKYGDYQF